MTLVFPLSLASEWGRLSALRFDEDNDIDSFDAVLIMSSMKCGVLNNLRVPVSDVLTIFGGADWVWWISF